MHLRVCLAFSDQWLNFETAGISPEFFSVHHDQMNAKARRTTRIKPCLHSFFRRRSILIIIVAAGSEMDVSFLFQRHFFNERGTRLMSGSCFWDDLISHTVIMTGRLKSSPLLFGRHDWLVGVETYQRRALKKTKQATLQSVKSLFVWFVWIWTFKHFNDELSQRWAFIAVIFHRGELKRADFNSFVQRVFHGSRAFHPFLQGRSCKRHSSSLNICCLWSCSFGAYVQISRNLLC